MKATHILCLIFCVFLFSCSKDDIYGYSIPKSFFGRWKSPEVELAGGEVKSFYRYVFTQNNIYEAIDGSGDADYLIDFNKDFPESDWEIKENIDGERYEIMFTPKNEDALTPWGTNLPFRRGFIHTMVKK